MTGSGWIGRGRRWGLAGAIPIALGLASPAQAMIDQTWISASEGVDSGSCLPTAPCATLAYAVAHTMPGGVVTVIDSGFYGVATIDRALTVRAELGQPLMVVSITVNAGVNDKVVFENITLEGKAAASGIAYPYGIQVLQAADVVASKVEIKDYNAAGTVGAGIYINGTTQTRVTMDESTVFNNTVGIWVTSAGGNAHLKLFRSMILSNGVSGVRVVGTGNDAMLSANQMLGSTYSLDLQNGGAARSFGNNALTSGAVPIIMSLY